jgi:hypothetical protein
MLPEEEPIPGESDKWQMTKVLSSHRCSPTGTTFVNNIHCNLPAKKEYKLEYCTKKKKDNEKSKKSVLIIHVQQLKRFMNYQQLRGFVRNNESTYCRNNKTKC